MGDEGPRDRGASARALPPGAPPDAVSIEEARRRWTSFRAEVWLTLAEVRGQHGRAATLRRLRPGSWPFRVVVGVAAPLLALRRRWRGPRDPAGATRPAFPFGDEPVVDLTAGWSPAGPVRVVRVDAAAAGPAVAALNAELGADGWIVVCDASDELVAGAPEALVARAEAAGADLAYGDEHRRDHLGGVHPVARPAALGAVALLSYDATGPVVALRCAALRRVGGFRVEAGRAWRHDAVVRLVESGAPAVHLAAVVATTAPENPRDAGARAVVTEAALARRAGGGVASLDPSVPGLVRWRPAPPPTWPRVAVVIPTRDRLDLLEACLSSLEARTTYPHYEVVIVDNGSVEPATRRFLAECAHRVVAAPGPFNYAAIVNRGVAATSAPFVVTLNNDVTVTTDDWLEQLVGVALLDRVGVVGAYLADPAGHPQHEGVAIAPYPQHLRRDRNYVVADAFLEATREVSAVTGACQLVRRELWDELEGMDEGLAVVHNDIDLCLRAQRRGWEVVYVPTVRLWHVESSTRGSLTPPEDIWRFIARWDVFGGLGDPWFPERLELLGDVVRWRRPAR